MKAFCEDICDLRERFKNTDDYHWRICVLCKKQKTQMIYEGLSVFWRKMKETQKDMAEGVCVLEENVGNKEGHGRRSLCYGEKCRKHRRL